MIEVKVQHNLSPEEAARRLRAKAAQMDVLAVDSKQTSERSGTMRKDTPLGSVEAFWEARETTVVVRVTQKPAFLPADTVRRMLQEGLEDTLA